MGTYEGNEGKKAKEMEKKYTRGEIKVKKGVWVSHANNKIEIEREVKELKITKNESLAEEKNLSKDTFFFSFSWKSQWDLCWLTIMLLLSSLMNML